MLTLVRVQPTHRLQAVYYAWKLDLSQLWKTFPTRKQSYQRRRKNYFKRDTSIVIFDAKQTVIDPEIRKVTTRKETRKQQPTFD